MSHIYLTLGDVLFQDFEIPEQISFGGQQRVAVHELIGGGRVVDAIGAQPSEIRFSGIFSGADAAIRARSVDAACAAAAPLSLGWDLFYYDVVISEFSADYCKPYWIPFEITCQVIADIANAASIAQIASGTLINADLGVAVFWAKAAGLVAGNITQAGASAAQIACLGSVNLAGEGLLSHASNINNPVTPADAVTALNSLSQNSKTLATSSYVGGYLARAVQNISMAAL